MMRFFRVKFLIPFIAAFAVYSAARAAEEFMYESRGKRDPFVPLIGLTDKPLVVKLEDVTLIEDLKLEGTAAGAGGKRTAILNGEMVKEGDTAGELEVKKITARSVTVSISGKPYTLSLYEEGGAKSE